MPKATTIQKVAPTFLIGRRIINTEWLTEGREGPLVLIILHLENGEQVRIKPQDGKQPLCLDKF